MLALVAIIDSALAFKAKIAHRLYNFAQDYDSGYTCLDLNE